MSLWSGVMFMEKVKLKGSNNYIYYDLENRIIGRKLTNSNLKEKSSDNSLYFGRKNEFIDEIILHIFGTSQLNDLVGKKFELNLCNISSKFEFNINGEGQRQLKMLDKGRLYKIFNYYKQYNNINMENDDVAFLLDLKNKKLLITKASNIIIENENFEKIVKGLIEKAKNEGIKPSDLEGYITTQINARNSTVQRDFRNELIKEFNSKCAICGIDKEELLIASHILPYHRCPSVSEMIDRNNGLLLCVLHDALFDKNYITFDQYGKLKISSEINKKMYGLFNIEGNISLNGKYMTDSRIRYLATHKIK